MTDSLRDQLLKLGFATKKPEAAKPRPPMRRPDGAARSAPKPRPQHRPAPGSQGAARAQEEIDLARAYALRAQAERHEAEQARREAERKAAEKRERKLRMAALLDGQALNQPDAEQPRHFEHGGKIKRVYCTEAQLVAINDGELGIVMQDGHFRIVARGIALQVRELEPRCLVLLVEPGGSASAEIDAGA